MFRNLILDWSGTLCNDLPPVLDTINRILSHFGCEPVSETAFLAEFQLPFDSFYEKRVPQATAEELESLFRAYFPVSQRMPEPIQYARDFVVARRREGCRLLILSAATAVHFHEQAERFGFVGLFDELYLGVRDKRKIIGEILRTHSLNPEETCFIGDMEHDVLAARHGGITSIAVLTGYDSASKLERAQPDLMVRDLGRLDFLFRRARGSNERARTKEG
jgi:phosphoglycolate phosphatase